jgi:hypothetical protein
MDVTALHAHISSAARFATEDRLEELLQAFPFAGSAVPKETRELAVALETVVEAINNHGDPATTAKRDKKLGARGHRRRLARGTHHTAMIARNCRRADDPAALALDLRRRCLLLLTWTATADEILAKVRWVEANVKQLVDNNSNNTNRITRHVAVAPANIEPVLLKLIADLIWLPSVSRGR